MLAVLGGLGAALIWAVGAVAAQRCARLLGTPLTLAWVMLIGLAILAVILPFVSVSGFSLTSIVWLFLGGAGNLAGLMLLYRGYRIGQLGVVMPIAATEGGIAALLAVAAGQPLSTVKALALIVTLVGVVLTAAAGRVGDGGPTAAHPDREAAAWAAAAAVSMGVSLFATGRAGALLPVAWAVLPPRLLGVAGLTVPLGVAGALHRPTGLVRLILIAGVCEVGGFFAYAAGARHGIAIAAVLATLTGAFGVMFGRLLFGERLHRHQLVGVTAILIGVSALSAVTA